MEALIDGNTLETPQWVLLAASKSLTIDITMQSKNEQSGSMNPTVHKLLNSYWSAVYICGVWLKSNQFN